MDEFLLLIRLILAAIFAVAGVGKFLDLDGSETAIKNFGVPANLAKPFSVLLPLGEMLIALLLIPATTAWFGAFGAFLLLLTFIGGMLYQMKLGNAPDCHCFGQIHSEPVGKKSLIRNGVFALLAFVHVVQGINGQGAGIFDSNDSTNENPMTFILSLATVGLLAAAVYFLKTISEQQTQIMRRIEVIELLSGEGGREVAREELTNPADGLPVGSPAPDFVLPDINDKNVAFEHLLAQAKPILFFFVSPTCVPCAALLPEIEQWQTELKGKVNFVFVSSGDVKANLEKFAGANLKQILIQKERETSELFGAQWTPTAVLINSDGTVASRLAAGDKAIRELVEKIKAENLDGGENLYIANGAPAKFGASLPEFFESDVFDKSVASNDFLGKKTLVTFWSPTCPHCTNMLEDLRAWDKSKGNDAPNLLVLSDGEIEAHKSMGLQSPVVLDKARKISKELGMAGTPSAVLINEDGKIVSETAVGAAQIWTLLGVKK